MVHQVLFKLAPGFSADTMRELYNVTYVHLPEEIPEVEHTAFYCNCVDRDCNMDVMIRVDLTCKDGLEKYLNHPLHQRFVKETQAHIMERVSFDWKEGSHT